MEGLNTTGQSPLLRKYKNRLSQRYTTIGGLNKALSSGMKEVCKLISHSGITYYWARRTVGNLARNKCRMSKDDVALALNHVDHGRKTTDYLNMVRPNSVGVNIRRGFVVFARNFRTITEYLFQYIPDGVSIIFK